MRSTNHLEGQIIAAAMVTVFIFNFISYGYRKARLDFKKWWADDSYASPSLRNIWLQDLYKNFKFQIIKGCIVQVSFSHWQNATWLLTGALCGAVCCSVSVPFIQALTGRNSSCVVAHISAPQPFIHFSQIQCGKDRFLLFKGLYCGTNAASLCIIKFDNFPHQMFLFWAELI